jgi:hypothetical protein
VTGKPNLSFYSDIKKDRHYINVVHCKKSDYDVYIGRPSKWGNPFSHKDGTLAEFKIGSRSDAIQKYEEWIVNQPHLMGSLHELKGKTLGCWCSPKRCHGHVLAKLVERHVE